MPTTDQCLTVLRTRAPSVSDAVLVRALEIVDDELATRSLASAQQGANTTKAAVAQTAALEAHARRIEARNRAINIQRRADWDLFRTEFRDDAQAFEALIAGINAPTANSRLSIEARWKAIESTSLGDLINELRADDLLDEFAHLSMSKVMTGKGNPELELAISRELWAIDNPAATGANAPGLSGNPRARKIAEAIQRTQEALRVRQNRAGAHIAKRNDFIVAQSHAMDKVSRAGFDAWQTAIFPRLDLEATYGIPAHRPPTSAELVEIRQSLQGSYDTIVFGRGETAPSADPTPAGFKGPGNLAKRKSYARSLHFKSAEDWHAYNTEFGEGGLVESVFRGIERNSRDIALMEVLGPNPRAMLDDLYSRSVADARGDLKAHKRLVANRDKIDNLMAEVDGSANQVANLTMARIGSGIRSVQDASKLGGVALSSISDIPVAVSEMRYQGMGFFEAWTEYLPNFLRGRRKGEQREFADLLGVGMEGLAGNVQARFSSVDGMPGFQSRAMQKFFSLTGLTWMTDAGKTASGLMLSRWLGKNINQPFGRINKDLRRSLRTFGIGDAEWSAMQRAAKKGADGKTYVLPSEIGKLSGMDPRARQELQTKVAAYITDRTDYAVLTPGARERAFMRRGLRKGTAPGEAFRMLTQYKSFPLAMIMRVWGRELYGRSGRVGAREMAGLMETAVMMTLFGYVAMSLKDISRNREPRMLTDDPEHNAKVMTAAIMQGGGAGILGDFLFGEMQSRYGTSPLTTALGPTAGSVESFFNLWGKARAGDAEAYDFFRFGMNHAPGINMFYLRAAIDYAFLEHIQEALNPGGRARAERRLRKETGQETLF